MKKLLNMLLICVMLLSLLAGCDVEPAEIATVESSTVPEAQQEPAEPAPIVVSTIDEFLSALNSNVTICLEKGDFRLDRAETYGKDSPNPAYYWENTGDGFQLVLNHLHDLTIAGAGKDSTTLLTSPRYANILVLTGCSRIRLEDLTLGHTDGGELCTGGVLELSQTDQISLSRCGLFGCGIWGVNAYNCRSIGLQDCDIYSCSTAGIRAASTSSLDIERCAFYELGTPQITADTVFSLENCTCVNIRSCSVTENTVMQLLWQSDCEKVLLEDTEFRANTVTASAFEIQGPAPVLDGCSLEGNSLRQWYSLRSNRACSPDGTLIPEDLLPPVNSAAEQILAPQEQIHVTTADEFLDALGPDREIILDGPEIRLSDASGYGTASGSCYFWEDCYDGPGLVIENVSNLTIRGAGTDPAAHTVLSVPRYADVLSFRHCDHITASGFTAGHIEGSECAGNVLGFTDCDWITVDSCGLFGCGVLGVSASYCGEVTVRSCDIYDCSLGGIEMWDVQGVLIRENTFRNLGGPAVILESCSRAESDVPLD